MELKKLNTLIATIGRNSAKVKADIQEALVGCAFFAQRDRNVDPAKRLFAAVGNEANRRAMSHWLSLNAPVYFKEEAPALADKRQKEFAGTMEEFEEEVRAMPAWYEHAKDGNKPQNVWDGVEQLRKAGEYLTKMAKKAREEGDEECADEFTTAAIKLVARANAEEHGE